MDISAIHEIFGPTTGITYFASGVTFLLGCLVLGGVIMSLKNIKLGLSGGLAVACLTIGISGLIGFGNAAINAKNTAEQQYNAAFKEHYGITITSEEALTVVFESMDSKYEFIGQRNGDTELFLAETHGEGDGMTLTVYEKVDGRYVDADRVE